MPRAGPETAPGSVSRGRGRAMATDDHGSDRQHPGRDPYAEGQIRLTRHLAIRSQVRVDRRLLLAI
jgi:hypothetical protein